MSFISTEGDCEDGAADMAYALDIFKAYSSPAKYAPAMQALQAAYSDRDTWRASIPFSARCSELQRIGANARQLADQILVENGVKPAPKPPESTALGDLKSIVWGFAIGAAIYYGAGAIKGLKSGGKR